MKPARFFFVPERGISARAEGIYGIFAIFAVVDSCNHNFCHILVIVFSC